MANGSSRERVVVPDEVVTHLRNKADRGKADPAIESDAESSLRPALREKSEPVAPAAVEAVAPASTRTAAERRGRWVRPILFALLPLALAISGYFYVVGGGIMSTDNAYVRADIMSVSTDVSGTVQEITVRDNQKVEIGDALFKLDELPFRLALKRADAQLGVVVTELNALKASYRDMQAQIQQAQVDVDFYARELERQQQLKARNIASEVAFEQAQRNVQSGRQRVASLNQQLNGIAANLAGNPDIPVEQHPRYASALAERDEAARRLDHATIRAPIAGVVTKVPSLQPGQYLAASNAAFSIVATDHVWIEANPKETELTYVRPGQKATITVDTYPDEEWHGTVDSVSPASAASFSLLPAQNTSGNWVKVVQRIPMRVRIDTPEGRPPLRAGMSVVLDVDTGHVRGMPGLLKSWASLLGLS